MDEEVKVSLVGDDGHKRRWGLENLLYRKEGRKLSINVKVTAWMFCLFILAGSAYSIISEFFKPTPTENSVPIAFTEQMGSRSSGSEKIQIPSGNSEFNRPAPTGSKSKVVVYYSAPQVIGRPNLGKIPPGTMVKAKFITGASNGPLKAMLVEALAINGEDIAPEGTTLVGSGSSGDDRLSVQFTKLVFRDGKSQSIQAQGCDLSDQTVGVKGKKLSKYAVLLATGAGLNFLGGVAEGLQETQVQNGVATKKSDLKNAALNGASKSALDLSTDVLSDMKSKKSVIQVESGKEFYVLFEGE
ncbi:MAG: TrbI/VirB10 family protein [Pseudomonadota bacterium]|nr:TrbI/VirB10 family protein [Pseudomonadota bacterium]